MKSAPERFDLAPLLGMRAFIRSAENFFHLVEIRVEVLVTLKVEFVDGHPNGGNGPLVLVVNFDKFDLALDAGRNIDQDAFDGE